MDDAIANRGLANADKFHDLRNKLSIIIGSTDILALAETLSPEGIEDIARIRRASVDALAIVATLETWAHPSISD